MIKVLLVDDEIILRESLKFIIEQDSEIEVVGCAGNGIEAFEASKVQKPDVVLMDIQMPISNGIEGTRLIKEQYKDSIKVVILTTFDDDENIGLALNSGSDGYILKSVSPAELILAVKSAASGFEIFHKNTVRSVIGKNNNLSAPKIDLTERERDVVKLIVYGMNNKEIAGKLFLTEGTVKNVITGILEKLQLRDRTQLAVYAIKNNLE
jgi:DNA-binding NarL/FixJ family response regulator